MNMSINFKLLFQIKVTKMLMAYSRQAAIQSLYELYKKKIYVLE